MITVIDSIMGSGKTSWAIQYMSEAGTDQRFIYVTPFLDEVKRVMDKTKVFKDFLSPQIKRGSKMNNLKELIAEGKNIVATHSLFQAADDELIELLDGAGYTLILDEVMTVIEQAPVKVSDVKLLIEKEIVRVENNRVIWQLYPYDDGLFADIKRLAESGNLFMHRNQFLIWSFPARIFPTFDNVFILTYLFDGQIQRYYYDLHGIKYEYKSVKRNGDRYELTEYNRDNEDRESLKQLITIYEGKLNEIGDRRNALSATWLKNANDKTIDRLKKNLYTFFRRHCGSKTNENLWTTLKARQNALKGKGYAKSFLHVTARATNEYGDRQYLAYVYNRFMSPIEKAFFEDAGVRVNEDLLALSDLLQWVWRARIRNGESITVYIPSSRMRNLFKYYLDKKI